MIKLLLVEDNEMYRNILGRRLKSRGYEVITAIDGREGLTKSHTENPDLILLDMGLPKITGWDLVRLLKASEVTQHTPIIAITAFALDGYREKALQVGCEGYMAKPVEFSTLIEQITTLVSQPITIK